jgi:hypothetical protein
MYLALYCRRQVDLVDEQLLEEFTAPEDQQVDPAGVGFALFLVNTAVPLAAIVLGGVECGWDARDVRAPSEPGFAGRSPYDSAGAYSIEPHVRSARVVTGRQSC